MGAEQLQPVTQNAQEEKNGAVKKEITP